LEELRSASYLLKKLRKKRNLERNRGERRIERDRL
jgi:hypothetical protein